MDGLQFGWHYQFATDKAWLLGEALPIAPLDDGLLFLFVAHGLPIHQCFVCACDVVITDLHSSQMTSAAS
jgi:hypothetical protein